MQSFWKILGLIPIFSDFKKRKDLIMKQTIEEAAREYSRTWEKDNPYECLDLMEECNFNNDILRPIVAKVFNV